MHAKLHEIETVYKRVLKEIEASDELSHFLLKIYYELVIVLSEASSLHFNTLFARVSFITSRYPMGKAWSYALQIPRREINQRQLTDEKLLPVLTSAIAYLFKLCHAELNGEGNTEPVGRPDLPERSFRRSPGKFKKPFARVVAIEWDKENKQLSILDEQEPDTTRILHYCVHGVNDIFSDTLELSLSEMGLPMILGLTDIECTEDDHYIPSFIVLIPDLLLDVTSITRVLTSGSDPLSINAMDIFLPTHTNDALMAGQVANYFLDELIRDTSKTFTELFAHSFKIYPIEFVGMTDDRLRQLQHRMKSHFDHILKVITERFPVVGIDRKACVIEPSYYSPQYGIKGRLDLYYADPQKKSASIIELKSNRPFKPNSYGLSSQNCHQTLLYDLLIKSSEGSTQRRANYILYSAESQDSLRYAVSIDSIQKETIHNRNQLVLLQFRLMRLDQDEMHDLFLDIHPHQHPEIKGYIHKNITNWFATYDALSPGEKSYFKFFTAFITREHMLARIGSERGDGTGGLAGLWLDTIETKEERYQILQGMELMSIEKDAFQTRVRFRKGEKTNPLANFRAGDIAVMYPHEDLQHVDPTRYQLHRANVISVDAQFVVIRLRNIQIHTGEIENIRFWNLEHDLLDSSYRAWYQSLWILMSHDVMTRQYILGLIGPPKNQNAEIFPFPDGLTSAQEIIYQKAIQAECLYLLWGPPGTGKTSVMLKSWVWYYYTKTKKRIALLAYTNKAVDEICDALHHSGDEIKNHYIRIGSSTASGESFRHRLLHEVIAPMSTRAEIKSCLDDTRIFVGTIASLQGKSELFNLLTFDIAIMDEASQLLEPAIVGLLTRFKKTILIGDHMQLPAISIQPEHLGKIKPGIAWAERIGLTDLSMSYFERMYRLYQASGWEYAIGTLYEQGRMHQDIMDYANQHVYERLLKPIDSTMQGIPLTQILPDESSLLFRKRLIFVPSVVTLREIHYKTNHSEAQYTLMLIATWQKKIREEKLGWDIGVITPFRAQIAAINHLGHLQGVDLTNVSIDTVERYQGGARDIIIMSCAVNSLRVLTKISSMTPAGIDRKLNVAVTRARQQFILIGAEEILKTQSAYRLLIEMSLRFHPEDILVNELTK